MCIYIYILVYIHVPCLLKPFPLAISFALRLCLAEDGREAELQRLLEESGKEHRRRVRGAHQAVGAFKLSMEAVL